MIIRRRFYRTPVRINGLLDVVEPTVLHKARTHQITEIAELSRLLGMIVWGELEGMTLYCNGLLEIVARTKTIEA